VEEVGVVVAEEEEEPHHSGIPTEMEVEEVVDLEVVAEDPDQDHPKEEGGPVQEADLEKGPEGIALDLEKEDLIENLRNEEDQPLVKDQCLKKDVQGLDRKDDQDRDLHLKTEIDQQVVLVRAQDPDLVLRNVMEMVTMMTETVTTDEVEMTIDLVTVGRMIKKTNSSF